MGARGGGGGGLKLYCKEAARAGEGGRAKQEGEQGDPIEW